MSDIVANAQRRFVAADGEPDWYRAVEAADFAICVAEAGRLRDAETLAARAFEGAASALRGFEGFMVQEAFRAYEAATTARITVEAACGDGEGVRLAVRDFAKVLRRAHEKFADYQRSVPIPFPGPLPSGGGDPEALLERWPIALATLLDGDAGEALAALEPVADRLQDDTRDDASATRLRLVWLRATALSGRATARDASIRAAFEALAPQNGLGFHAGHLAGIDALRAAARNDLEAARRLSDAALQIASRAGLGYLWFELIADRLTILVNAGLSADALEAATICFADGTVASRLWVGDGAPPGAAREGHRRALEAAASAFGTRALPDRLATALYAARARRPAGRVGTQRAFGRDFDSALSREALHRYASAALAARREAGRPLVVYFRKFGIEITHHSSEFGPDFLENALLDALPERANVIAIQDGDSDAYEATPIMLRRRVPAFVLDDDVWQDIASEAIAVADLIVSECMMLSDGVRFELQRAREFGRMFETVLVLPPPNSYLATLDNDPLVRAFPIAVWGDGLHQTPLHEDPVAGPAIARLSRLAGYSDDALRTLTAPAARTAREPLAREALARGIVEEGDRMAARADSDGERAHRHFWTRYRAAIVYDALLEDGEGSDAVRERLALCQLEMARTLMTFERDGDRTVLKGDLAFALRLAKAAYETFSQSDGDAARHYAAAAATLTNELDMIAAARRQHPDRFLENLAFGPF